MTPENRKTAIFVGVAAALMATAVVAGRPATTVDTTYKELGAPFFPSLTLPSDAVALEVVEFDPTTGRAHQFKVALEDGRWVIPSHSNYPADARDRLARTASRIFDLKHDSIRGDRPDDHRAMGVLDPLDTKVLSSDGVGRRVTLRDKDGNALADLIVGNAVPEQPGQRFVRRPGQNRVYGVNLDALDLSTRFSDWIETDLLKLDGNAIRSVLLDNHKFDPVANRFDKGEALTILKRQSPPRPNQSPWILDGLPPDQEVNAEAMNTLASTLSGLRILGVRQKPKVLSDWLKATPETRDEFQLEAASSLQSKGFYIVGNRLVSADGDVNVSCDDGVVYSLRFGGVTFARGDSLSAGSGEESAATDPKPGDSSGIESRFLFVTAAFDPDLIPKPRPHVKGELPEDVFARSAVQRRQLDQRIAAARAAEVAAYERKLRGGEARAKQLSDRFADWYYVVPGDAFRKIVLDRKSVTQRKGTRPPAASPFSGGAFPGGGLPMNAPR